MTTGEAFLHCARCGELLRQLPSDDPDSRQEVEAFLDRHAACGVELLRATGRSRANGPFHEPLSTRRVEVAGHGGLAVAVGTRTSLEEPLRWCLEPGELDEEVEVELDEEEFWDVVDRALFPHHLPLERLRAWAAHLARIARSAAPEDLLLLFDDPRDPSVSRGGFTPTAAARIEGALGSFGFDPLTEQRLADAFASGPFPPLRIHRRSPGSAARRDADRSLDTRQRLV